MCPGIYALLVGINDYSPAVGKLRGCLNDVDHFHDYLADNFDRDALHIEVLKDADATRENVIRQNEWFTKDLHVKLVRQIGRVTAHDATGNRGARPCPN